MKEAKSEKRESSRVFTRRGLVAGLVPAAILAQTPASAPDELKAAQDRLQANSDALSKLAVPIETEPAFQFRA